MGLPLRDDREDFNGFVPDVIEHPRVAGAFPGRLSPRHGAGPAAPGAPGPPPERPRSRTAFWPESSQLAAAGCRWRPRALACGGLGRPPAGSGGTAGGVRGVLGWFARVPMEFPSLFVLMIRHGHASAGGLPYGPDTALSSLGQRQAISVADAIVRTRPIAAIYSSPFLRSLESARPLCDRLGKTPVVDDRLAEFQLAPAPSTAERQDLAIWQPLQRGVPGGETLEEFSLRVSQFMEETCVRHSGEVIALYTHSGTIDAAARWAVGLPPESEWRHDLPLSNASITELQVWPRGRVPSGAPRYVAFLRIGDVGHLDPSARGPWREGHADNH